MTSLDLSAHEFAEVMRLAENPTDSAVNLALPLLAARGLIALRDDRVWIHSAMQVVIDCLAAPQVVVSLNARTKHAAFKTVVTMTADVVAVAVTDTAEGVMLSLLDRKAVATRLVRDVLPSKVVAPSKALSELALASETSISLLIEAADRTYAAGVELLLMEDGSAAVIDESNPSEPRQLAGQAELEAMILDLSTPLVEFMGA